MAHTPVFLAKSGRILHVVYSTATYMYASNTQCCQVLLLLQDIHNSLVVHLKEYLKHAHSMSQTRIELAISRQNVVVLFNIK